MHCKTQKQLYTLTSHHICSKSYAFDLQELLRGVLEAEHSLLKTPVKAGNRKLTGCSRRELLESSCTLWLPSELLLLEDDNGRVFDQEGINGYDI
jgi:hypothetical protein